jgi:hypothetical protein
MKRFRLGLLLADEQDGCSWYRALGPLRHLSRFAMPELEFVHIGANPTWSSFFNCDAVFIQRPHTQSALEWVEAARLAKVPVWLDADDDLFHVPPGHSAYFAFQRTQESLKRILEAVTVISVSTQALADTLRQYTQAEIFIIPNAVDETYIDPAPMRELDPAFLTWRGSNTHREDMEIAKALMTDENIKMHYWGALPPWVRGGHDMISPWVPASLFPHQLKLTPAGCLIVPLLDNKFNRAKSNCSWLEATWAGLATCHFTNDITPLPEFDKPGVLTLEQLRLSTPESLSIAQNRSLEYVLDNLTLSKVNEQRAELLRGL